MKIFKLIAAAYLVGVIAEVLYARSHPDYNADTSAPGYSLLPRPVWDWINTDRQTAADKKAADDKAAADKKAADDKAAADKAAADAAKP